MYFCCCCCCRSENIYNIYLLIINIKKYIFISYGKSLFFFNTNKIYNNNEKGELDEK